MGYAMPSCSSFSFIFSFYDICIKNLILITKMILFAVLIFKNETQPCYSGMLSFPFTYFTYLKKLHIILALKNAAK